jgi:hypothetical protein
MSVSFITSVNESTFNLFITTSNKDIIELVELYAVSLNLIFNQQVFYLINIFFFIVGRR